MNLEIEVAIEIVGNDIEVLYEGVNTKEKEDFLKFSISLLQKAVRVSNRLENYGLDLEQQRAVLDLNHAIFCMTRFSKDGYTLGQYAIDLEEAMEVVERFL